MKIQAQPTDTVLQITLSPAERKELADEYFFIVSRHWVPPLTVELIGMMIDHPDN